MKKHYLLTKTITMELKDYKFVKGYATHKTYSSAELSTEVIKFVDLEDVVKAFTKKMQDYDNCRISEYSKWETRHDIGYHCFSQTTDYDTNLYRIKEEIENYGEYDCAGGIPSKYKIKITKIGGNYKMETTTYCHIVWSGSSIRWVSDEERKNALAEKISYLQKNGEIY